MEQLIWRRRSSAKIGSGIKFLLTLFSSRQMRGLSSRGAWTRARAEFPSWAVAFTRNSVANYISAARQASNDLTFEDHAPSSNGLAPGFHPR